MTALNDNTRKERTKKVVIKHKTKIYTESCYFSMKIGCKQYQQRKEVKLGVHEKSQFP